MLPSVRELLAFGGDHTSGPRHQQQLQHAFPLPSAGAASAAASVLFQQQPHPEATSPDAAESTGSGYSSGSHSPRQQTPHTMAHRSAPSNAKQRPGRKVGASDRYSASNGARNYRCGVHSCAALFKRPEHLKRHMLTHTQQRPFRCSAQGCGKRFSRRDNYVTHKKKHSSSAFPSSSSEPRQSSATSSVGYADDVGAGVGRATSEMRDLSVGSDSTGHNTPVSSASPMLGPVSSIFNLLNDGTAPLASRQPTDGGHCGHSAPAGRCSASPLAHVPGTVSLTNQPQPLPPLVLPAPLMQQRQQQSLPLNSASVGSGTPAAAAAAARCRHHDRKYSSSTQAASTPTSVYRDAATPPQTPALPLPPLELLAYASSRTEQQQLPPQPLSSSTQPASSNAASTSLTAAASAATAGAVPAGAVPAGAVPAVKQPTQPPLSHSGVALPLPETIRASLSGASQTPDGHRVETSYVAVEQPPAPQQQQPHLDASLPPSVVTTATSGDPSKPFMCSICGSRFGRLEHVKRHHLVHTGERLFTCPSCSKTFARKDNMIQHLRAHERKRASA